MAYTSLPSADVQAGKPNKEPIFTQIKTNQDDHESRILTAESALINKHAESLFNVGIDTSISSGDLTISLTQQSGAALSSAAPANVNFRSVTQTSGANASIDIDALISLTLPAGATIGNLQSSSRYYLYLLNNSGTGELAISSFKYENVSLVSTIAISTGSTSITNIYSINSRSNVPFTLIGAMEATRDGSNNWTSVEKIYVGKIFEEQRDSYISSDINDTKNTTSEIDIPNATLSNVKFFTKPIQISLVNHTTNNSLLNVGTSTTAANGFFNMYRSVAGAGSWSKIGTFQITKSSGTQNNGCTSFKFFDDPGTSGLYDYKMTRSITSSTSFTTIIGRLFAVNY